jgi:hypothetical protein
LFLLFFSTVFLPSVGVWFAVLSARSALVVAGVVQFPFAHGDFVSSLVSHVWSVHLSLLPESMPLCFATLIITLLFNQSIHFEKGTN